jgi:uncharacterized protein involved in outer membrane biogenesis
MRRVLLIVCLSLFVVAAAVFAGAAYLLHNETFLKARLRALVLDRTGRALAIDGPLQVDLGAESTLEARGVRLQNADWAGGGDMLAVGRLQVSLDLRSLFAGLTVIPSLLLEDCSLLFVKAADGARNWQLGADGADAPKDGAATGPPVLVREGQVRNCRLRFESPQREQALDVAVSSFSLQLEEDGRWLAAGAGRVGPETLSFEGFLTPFSALLQGGPLSYEVSAAAGEVTLRSSGTFADVRSGRGADLTMRFAGPEIAQVLAQLGQAALSTGPFDFRLDLDTPGPMIQLELDGDLGSLEARAEGELDRLFRPTQGRLKGAVTGPNLEALGQTLGLPGLAAQAYELRADAGFEPGLVRVRELNLASAGDRLAVSGVLGTGAALAGSDLSFDLAMQDASRLAVLLGKPVQVPGPITLQGRLASDADGQASLQARAEYFASVLAVDGSLGLLSRPLQPDLRVDFHSTDPRALAPLLGNPALPHAPAAVRGRVSKPDALLRLDAVEVELADHRARIAGRLAPGQPFTGSELKLRVESPSARRLGRLFDVDALPEAPVRLTATMTRPEQPVLIEGIDLDLAGHRVRGQGRLNPQPGLAGSRLELQLDTPDVAQFASLFGQSGLPHQPLRLDLSLAPEDAGLRFSSRTVEGGDIRVAIEGHVADLAEPHGIDARFDVSLPSLSLLGFRAPDGGWPDLPLAARGELRNSRDRTQLENVELQLGTVRAEVAGRLLPDRRFDLTVQAEGPDAAELQHLIGLPLPSEAFTLQTRLAGEPSAFELGDLAATLGRNQAAGTLAISTGVPRRIAGELRVPLLDLSGWAKARGQPEAAPETTPGGRSQDYVFDDTPVTEIIDHGVELDLDLAVEELDLGHTQLQDIALGAKLAGQRLELSPLALRGAVGGQLSGRLSLDVSSGTPRLDLELHGRDLRFGLEAVEGQDSSTIPPAELQLRLTGSGVTQREMASGMNGSLRYYRGSGLIATAGLQYLFTDFITELLTQLNPFAERSRYTELLCVVAAADIVDGQMRVSPVVIHTQQLTIFSQGTIDLRTEKLDLSFNTKPRQGLGLSTSVVINPFIKVGGRLAKPAIELDPKGAAVSGSAAVATAGLTLLAKSISDRFLSSRDPCGDARKEIEKREQTTTR